MIALLVFGLAMASYAQEAEHPPRQVYPSHSLPSMTRQLLQDDIEADSIIHLSFFPENNQLLAASSKGELYLWDLESNRFQRKRQNLPIQQNSPWFITQDRSQVWFETTDNWLYSFWMPSAAWGERFELPPQSKVFGVRPEASQVVLGNAAGDILLWNWDSRTQDRLLWEADSQDDSAAARLSPQGDLIAFITPDHPYSTEKRLIVRDLESGQIRFQETFPFESIPAWLSCDWTQDQHYFFVKSTRFQWGANWSRIDLFEMDTGHHLRRMNLVSSEVEQNLNFSDDARMVFEAGADNNISLYDIFAFRELARFEAPAESQMALSPDRQRLAIGSAGEMANNNPVPPSVTLYDLSGITLTESPTLVPSTPTPQPNPPAPTPTPVNTLPKAVDVGDEAFEAKTEAAFPTSNPGASLDRNMAVHPITGDLMIRLGDSIYRKAAGQDAIIPSAAEPMLSFAQGSLPEFYDICATPDGGILGVGPRNPYANPQLGFSGAYLVTILPDGAIRQIELTGYRVGMAVYSVREQDQIAGANPGDALVLVSDGDAKSLLAIDPRSTEPNIRVLLSSNVLPVTSRNLLIGPEGHLNIVTTGPSKLYRYTALQQLNEISHIVFGNVPFEYSVDSMAYLPEANAYFTSSDQRRDLYNRDTIPDTFENILTRLSEDAFEQEVIDVRQEGRPVGINKIAAAPDGETLYLELRDSIQSLRYRPQETGTQTPRESQSELPHANPTPNPFWYVMDGFGGIHKSHRHLPQPVLPYLPGYDIFRDLEPDPSGRGWYMLDGLGGIHRSSENLPPLEGLPYFGFDIARNLELREGENGLLFYMLDGFGVIHTNDPDFDYGNLPWLGEDFARDLEPDTRFEGWLLMDRFGLVHASHRPTYDLPLDPTLFRGGMIDAEYLFRAMVRTADERTVILDGYGGRHTNRYHPALNVMEGISRQLYFPGFDIFWDVENVPGELSR